MRKTTKYLLQEHVTQPRFKPDVSQTQEQCVSSGHSKPFRFHKLNPNNSI